MKFFKVLSLFLFIVLISCNIGGKQKYLPSSIGAINQITVVMDNELWKGEVGDKVREHFAAPAIGLTWNESIFTLNHVPPKVFTGAIQNSRAVVYVEKDSVNEAGLNKDMYATPQHVVIIKGATNEE